MVITNERERERGREGEKMAPQFLYNFYHFRKSFSGYFVYTIKIRDKKWDKR